MGDATSKLMRGLVEAFLLDSIAREPKHGYALLRELEQAFGEPPNRNQVYPMLNRLEREGYLHADREAGRGKTRYGLTGKGLELLKEYRLRSPLFRARLQALWPPELGAPAPREAPPPGDGDPGEAPTQGAPAPEARPPDPGPRLLDRLAPPDAPPAGRARHAPGPCAAEVVLRRQPGRDRFALEVGGLDPACPTCQDLYRGLRELRDRWF